MSADKEFEERKLQAQFEIAEKQLQIQMIMATQAWAVDLAKLALQSVIAVNGGAAVALLAFIPHVASTNPSEIHLGHLTFALCLFTAGVVTGVFCAGIGYLCQLTYAHAYKFKDHKFSLVKWRAVLGDGLRVIAIIGGFSALGIFGWGVAAAINAFRAL
ncbi:MAG: hypothetical protein IT562_08480 [Alphaproteobacteria bacterium]|nr:hypothetical protein [Alphaproteobacteria bacterium]